MENKYYAFRTEAEFLSIIEKLKSEGYTFPVELDINFDMIKSCYSRNKIYIINSYYNSINKSKEFIVGTKQIFEHNTKSKIKLSII